MLMVKCFGIHLVFYFVNPETKHLVHGVELIIWIGHHLVLNSAYCLEGHLVLNLLQILVLSLESMIVYRLVLRLVFAGEFTWLHTR